MKRLLELFKNGPRLGNPGMPGLEELILGCWDNIKRTEEMNGKLTHASFVPGQTIDIGCGELVTGWDWHTYFIKRGDW